MTTMTEERLIGSAEVCRILRISYRQLDYWVRAGVVEAAVHANGSGSYRKFTAEQVRQLRLVAGLREVGLPLERIKRVGPDMMLFNTIEDLQALAEQTEIA